MCTTMHQYNAAILETHCIQACTRAQRKCVIQCVCNWIVVILLYRKPSDVQRVRACARAQIKNDKTKRMADRHAYHNGTTAILQPVCTSVWLVLLQKSCDDVRVVMHTAGHRIIHSFQCVVCRITSSCAYHVSWALHDGFVKQKCRVTCGFWSFEVYVRANSPPTRYAVYVQYVRYWHWVSILAVRYKCNMYNIDILNR